MHHHGSGGRYEIVDRQGGAESFATLARVLERLRQLCGSPWNGWTPVVERFLTEVQPSPHGEGAATRHEVGWLKVFDVAGGVVARETLVGVARGMDREARARRRPIGRFRERPWPLRRRCRPAVRRVSGWGWRDRWDATLDADVAHDGVTCGRRYHVHDDPNEEGAHRRPQRSWKVHRPRQWR